MKLEHANNLACVHRSSSLVFKEICKKHKDYTIIRSIQSKATFKHIGIRIIGHEMSQFRANIFFVYKQKGGRG